MTTGIIIQARMTSLRFPGKVLAKLNGRTVLERVVGRALQVPLVDQVIVAHPTGMEHIPIMAECERLRIASYGGPEHDVLARYYGCATAHVLDVVMRITADCPYIDPTICGAVLEDLLNSKSDYVCNCIPGDRTFPKGWDCEVFTRAALVLAHRHATEPYDREHVTPWMQRSRALKRTNLVWAGDNGQTENHSHINLCVDYPSDIERLEREYPQFIAMMEAKDAVVH